MCATHGLSDRDPFKDEKKENFYLDYLRPKPKKYDTLFERKKKNLQTLLSRFPNTPKDCSVLTNNLFILWLEIYALEF